MAPDTRTFFLRLGLGMLAATAIACSAGDTDDEDRPPIIVRGGSLIFETEKKWKQKVTDTWTPDHPRGHWVGTYAVSFDAGSGSCAPAYTREVTIYFKPDGKDVETAYRVTRADRGGSSNKKEPVVIGPGLKEDNTLPKPTLTLAAAGKIARVEFQSGPQTSSTCLEPRGLNIAIVR